MNENKEPEMSQAELDAQMERWFDEEREKLGADKLSELDEQTTDRIVSDAVAIRWQEEFDKNAAFRAAQIRKIAAEDLEEYLKEHRPKGAYDPEAFLPLNGEGFIKMRYAKRDHLFQWALLESDDKNLAYITSRLEAWDETKHKTLADLESEGEGVR